MTSWPPSVTNVARPPQVRNVPPYTWSVGPEAIKLAASCGLVADDWQELIVTDQLGKRDDGKFAAIECGDSVPRQNGKGVVIEIRKLAGLFLLEERVVMYTAHEFKTAERHFRRMKEYIRNSDEMSRQVKRISGTNGKEGIELYGTGRHRLTRTRELLYIARSKGSGRGFTGDGCLFLDEAQYLTAAHLAALLPTLSAVTLQGDPQLLYSGTPPDPTDATSEGGSYWVSVRNRGVAGTGRLCWHEYSPPAGFDRADREVWRATNPAMGVRIDEEYVATVELEAMVAAGTPQVFDRERLGEWPPDPSEGWHVIPEAAWRAAYDPGSAVEDPVCFAVATNLARTWTTIAIAGRRKDGLWHIEIIDRRPGVAWAIPRLAGLLGKWRNCGLVLVAAGPTGALIPDLESTNVTSAKTIEVIKASTQDFAKACGMVYVGITGQKGDGDEDPRRLRHRSESQYQAALDEAVKAMQKHQTGDVWTVDRDVEVDTSPAEAAAMAVWGFASFGQNAPNLPVTVSAELRKDTGDFFRPRERLKI